LDFEKNPTLQNELNSVKKDCRSVTKIVELKIKKGLKKDCRSVTKIVELKIKKGL
jgi:phosphotransferase system HPr-like phosphotransfer protein